MHTIETTVTVAADGSVAFEEPLRLPSRRHRVVVLLGEPETGERDDLGWPRRFFETTYGALADDPIVRAEQGTLQAREPLE